MKQIDIDMNSDVTSSLNDSPTNILKKKQLDAVKEAIILQNPFHIWAVNPNYQLIFMNKLFESYIEYYLDVSLKLGDNILELPLEDNIVRNWQEYYDTALAGESLFVDGKLDLKSGIRYVTCQFCPLRFPGDDAVWGVLVFGTDDSALMKIKGKLLKYRTLYQQAERLLGVGSCEWDLEKGDIIPYDNWLAIHGISKEKMTLPEFMQLAHPEDAEKIKTAFEQALSGTKPYNLEHRIVRENDGQIRIVKSLAEVLKGANGEPVKVYGVVQDITDMRSMHENYQENLEKYKQLYELISDAVFLIDNETGNILEANNAASTMYGYRHEELLTLKNTSLSAEPDKTRCATMHRLDTVPVRYHRKKDGTVFPVEINASHYEFNGNPVHIAAIRDISERLQKDMELKRSENNYRSIFNASTDAIFVLDSKTNIILEANEKAAEIFGYSKEENGKLKLTGLIDFWPGSTDRKMSFEALMEKARQNHERIELLGQTRFRESLWLEVNFRKTTLSDRECIMVVMRDIDERKHLESQLIQSQKMEALGALAGRVAHDFNNIITSITGYTELLALKDYSIDLRNSYLGQVLKACERAKNLVNQILLFGSHHKQERKGVDVRMIVREVLQLLRVSIPSTIKIHQNLSSQATIVSADSTQIHQVVMNLCTNAAHAMKDSSGIMNVSVINLEVSEEMASAAPDLKAGPYVHLQVADNGCGIDPFIIDKIFDPFFTAKKSGKGTGLGLAVVKDIVKKHDGFITVKSKLDKGTTLDVYLPRIDGETDFGKEKTDQPH